MREGGVDVKLLANVVFAETTARRSFIVLGIALASKVSVITSVVWHMGVWKYFCFRLFVFVWLNISPQEESREGFRGCYGT